MIGRYKKNRDLRLEGKYPGLPLYLIYPKLGKYIPSLPREVMLLIFAATNGGKTQFWKRLALEMCKLHYNNKVNTKPLFIVNLLEESIEEFEDSLVVMIYYDYYKKDISEKKFKKINKLKLLSYTEEYLTEEEFERVQKIIPLVRKFIDLYFNLEANIYNAFGLYKRVRDIARNIGTFYYEPLLEASTLPKITYKELIKLPKVKQEEYKFSSYQINDEELFPIVITDHLELLSPEKGEDKWTSMRNWSFEYGRKQISKNFKFNVINILQATAESQKKEYDYKGNLNFEKLKPSLDAISANKVIAQDHHVVFGVFDPYRYAVTGLVDGIDLGKTEGQYRSNTILKNRIGPNQREIPMYFDGSCSIWKEIDENNLDEFYKLCKE